MSMTGRIIAVGSKSVRKRVGLSPGLAALALIVLHPTAAVGAPTLVAAPAEQVARPGDLVEVAAEASDVRSCTLSLRTGGAGVRSTTGVRSRATISWRWRVPRAARRARWAGTVSCRRGRVSAAPAAARAVAVSIVAARTGDVGLVDEDGMTVSVEGPPDAAPQPVRLTEIGQLLVAFFGLTFVGWQLWHNARQAQRQRTGEVAERRTGREWFELSSRVRPWYLQVERMSDCLERIRIWEEATMTASQLDINPRKHREQFPTLSDVHALLGLNEETGVLFNTRNIDRKHMIRYYGEELVLDFDLAWWWIHWQRDNRLVARDPARPGSNETSLYAEWEKMALTILDRRRDLNLPKRGGLWVLCIPEVASDVNRTRDSIWMRHTALSLSLSRPMTQLEELERALDRPPLAEATNPKGRVVCVPPWRTPRGELERIQLLARRLSVRFETAGGFNELQRVAKRAGGG